LPEGANRPEKKQYGNVFGCGLVLDPDNKLAIFFTLNGQLLGKEAGGFQDLQKKFYIYLHMYGVRFSILTNTLFSINNLK
jgi:hypothetical protein